MALSKNLRTALKVRRFNRFYTKYMGFLNRKMMGSDYSFTEARLLYELSHRKMTKASVLTADLGLDPGYLSRILSRFEKSGLLRKQPCKIDARSTRLITTEKGEKEAELMGDLSNSYISEKLQDLTDNDAEKLLTAMDTIKETLENSTHNEPKDRTVVLRGRQPGDIGWVIQVLGKHCAKEFGFNENFEIKMAQSATNFISNYVPHFENCWIAELNGEKVGSIFLTKETTETAAIRLFYISPNARGLRLGQRLIDECLKFARHVGYKQVELWTTKNLGTARHLYQKAGFELIREQHNSEFGPQHTNQHWALDL